MSTVALTTVSSKIVKPKPSPSRRIKSGMDVVSRGRRSRGANSSRRPPFDRIALEALTSAATVMPRLFAYSRFRVEWPGASAPTSVGTSPNAGGSLGDHPIRVDETERTHAEGSAPGFPGIAMLIIFIAHAMEPLGQLIPARFGFSDATEMFVFAPAAAAIAFGGTFIKAGFGTEQPDRLSDLADLCGPYGMFFFIATLLATATAVFPGPDYVNKLNLGYFFANTRDGIIGLFTLSYVPNYFDILPMYMVALMMVPLMMALAR